MSRPSNKVDIINLSARIFSILLEMVENIPESASNNLNGRDKNSRDVISHLHEWHLMTIRWYNDGISGKNPIMPAPNYTWRTTKELNKKIWEKYQSTTLKEALNLFQESHNKIVKIIEKHNDEELFTKNYYSWTKSTSLGAWFVSATSSHYLWAVKSLKKIDNYIPIRTK